MSGLIQLLKTYFNSLGFDLSNDALGNKENLLVASVIEDLSYYALADNRTKEQIRLTSAIRKLNEVIYNKDNKVFAQLDNSINHPKHYNSGSMETIVFLKKLGLTEDFCLGNAIKYLSRYRYKGKPIEDLRKALWYVEYLIEKD